MHRFLLLLTLLCVPAAIVRAAPARSGQRYQLLTRGGQWTGALLSIYDKAEPDNSLAGATVVIASGRDTLRGAAVKSGAYYSGGASFRCDKLFRDSVELRITFLGYKEFRQRFSAYEFVGFIEVPMEQDTENIGQVVVIGEQVAMILRGDTIVHNAGAYKTFSDDRFSELLRQLPGVEIRDNKIIADGKEVKRIYVDGRNFFGDNPEHALTDMTASDVRSVRVYEEPGREAKFRDDPTAEKEQVMDVETKSKRSSILGGEAILLGGASIEKDYSAQREVRHAEQLSLYRHNEKGSLRLSAANSKDQGNLSETAMQANVTPSKRTSLRANYALRRGDTTMVMTRFSFGRDRTSNRTRSLTDYFPTADYRLRLDDRLADALAKNLSADLDNSAFISRGRHMISARLRLQLDDRSSLSRTRSTQTIDADETRTHMHTDRSDRSLALQTGVMYALRLTDKATFSVDLSGSLSRGDRDGWQVDTLASVPGLRTFLRSDGDSRAGSLRASAMFQYKTGSHSSLNVSYDYTWERDRSTLLALDLRDDPAGRLDTLNSHRFTNRTRSHALQAGWLYYKEGVHCNLFLKGSLREVSRDETFPREEYFPRRFFTLNPNFVLIFEKPQRQWAVSLHSQSQPPETEALRPTLNTTDPQWLQGGNPDLKTPTDLGGSVSFTSTDARSARTVSFALNGSSTFNYVAAQRTLFLEDTYLAQYDYTAQKGAQLTTQLNVGGCYNLGGTFNYSQQLRALRSTLNLNLNYNFARTPYFIDSALYDSDNHVLAANVGLTTGFSTKIRIDLSSSTALARSTTREATSDNLTERVHARVDLRLGKYFCFVGTAYEFYCNDRSKELTRHSVVLNASAGRKFGQKERFSLSVGGVDLLSRPDNTRTLFEADYIRTSSVSYLGRYLYLRAGYTF